MEDSRVFIRSDILLDHRKLKRIQDVLHHSKFNASEVDHDMHERLLRAVEEVKMEIIDMWQDGDMVQGYMVYNESDLRWARSLKFHLRRLQA